MHCNDDLHAPSGEVYPQLHGPRHRPSHHTCPHLFYPPPSESFGSAAVIHTTAIVAALCYEYELLKAACRGRFAQPHQCRSVHKEFILMGVIFCCAHHMSFDFFWHLRAILLQHITAAMNALSNYKRVGGELVEITPFPPVPNGEITSSIQACALCHFAGSSPYKIMVMFCILYQEVLSSVWIIVDATNTSLDFQILYIQSLKPKRKLTQDSIMQAHLVSTIVLE